MTITQHVQSLIILTTFTHNLIGTGTRRQDVTTIYPSPSIVFLSKSYSIYGVSALVISIIYCVFLALMMVQVYRESEFAKTLFIWMFIYNCLISEICLYLLFKPFQFYHQDINVGTVSQPNVVVCEIDSIKDTTENLFNVVIWSAMLLIIMHFVYMGAHVCLICFKCYESRMHFHRGRQHSVNLTENSGINDGTLRSDRRMNIAKLRQCVCKWSVIGIVIMLMMVFFLGLTIYATIVMIAAGTRSDDYDTRKLAMISVVTVLVFASLIDSPWVWFKVKRKYTGTQTMPHGHRPIAQYRRMDT
eukprot:894325_1